MVQVDESIKKGSPFRTLRWRILLWMLPVALGPLVIMAVQGYHCARQAVIASQEIHLQSVLESRRIEIDSWFAQIQSDFSFLQISPCLRGLCGLTPATIDSACCAETCNLLDDLHRGSAYYRQIGTYDHNWNQLISSSGTLSGPTDSSFPLKMLRDSLSIVQGFESTPPIKHEDGSITSQVGCRVSDPERGGLAFIAAEIDVSGKMASILGHRTGLGQTGGAYLVMPVGTYPAIDTSRGASGIDPAGDLPRSILNGTGVVERYTNISGENVLGVSTMIPDLEGILIVEIEEREAFAWLRVLRNRALATGLITLAVVLFIAFLGAKILAQPLRELTAVARRIAGGHSEERVGRLTGAEAQEVAQAFNFMIDELSASHKRLLQAASLAAVGELSSSIVHEMRNPLSTIKMNLQALRHKVGGDPAHSELADIASEQVLRFERMLSELLNYGKPLELNKSRLLFIDIAENVKEMLRPETVKAGVEVVLVDQTGGAGFVADPEQLHRALTNLVSNAIQASPKGGSVDLSSDFPTEFPGMIRFSVADDGPGIRIEDSERLFQPFYTTRDEGTGLGLANVKKIVECHDGSVSVEGKPGGGALFRIMLPTLIQTVSLGGEKE